jgi:hypothetical protein
MAWSEEVRARLVTAHQPMESDVCTCSHQWPCPEYADIRAALAEIERLRADLMRAAVVMGSPKDADRLAEALGYVLSGYRQRAEAAEANLARIEASVAAHLAGSAEYAPVLKIIKGK